MDRTTAFFFFTFTLRHRNDNARSGEPLIPQPQLHCSPRRSSHLPIDLRWTFFAAAETITYFSLTRKVEWTVVAFFSLNNKSTYPPPGT